MNARTFLFPLVFASALALAGAARAQAPQPSTFPELPAASPTASLKQRVGLTDVQIVYSRPSMRRRPIFGGIVPYGQVWRTGANASTKISFSTDVKLNGVAIPKGEYALYTIPDDKEWTVIIYSDPGLWGAFDYDQKKDFARFQVTPVRSADPVETFTIEFNNIRDDSAILSLAWANLRLNLKLEVDIVPDLLIEVDAAMSAPGKKQPGIYLQAATFYFNHSPDWRKALLWVDQGLEGRPPIAYELLYLKAQILAKQGDKTGAAAAAQQSLALAVKAEGPASSFVKMNQELISRLH